MTSSPNLRVRRRLAFAPIAVALFVIIAAGCGSGSVGYSEGNGDRANGKALFVKNCGSCHTLADAGTSGTIGPNLDQLKPPQSIVQRQVTNGGGAMPAFKGQLTPAQITAVAKYVSSVAGKS
jgi:mono/diheme cytochrome c family protein